jgi:integrase
MARIYKRENIWYLDVRVKGHRIRRRVGTSKKIAELALSEATVKIERDEFGFTKHDISIDKLIERFLEYNRTNHRPTTTERYKEVTDHLKRYLSEKHPGLIAVSQLSTEVLEGYKTYRRDTQVNPNGKPVNGKDGVTRHTRVGVRARTVNFELDAIKAMLNLAIRWGYLKDNAVRFVKPLKTDDKKPVRFLTLAECDKLLATASDKLYPIYFTFLNTGLRKAELENLLWSDIDFKRSKIWVRAKENWKPKTGEREIPVGEDLVKVLTELRAKSTKTGTKDYVFSVQQSGRSHNWLRTELIKLAAESGIPDLTRVHTLRHTYASHLVMNGVDLPTVSKLMGHSDIETTMIYAHLAPDHLANAVTKLPFKKR